MKGHMYRLVFFVAAAHLFLVPYLSCLKKQCNLMCNLYSIQKCFAFKTQCVSLSEQIQTCFSLCQKYLYNLILHQFLFWFYFYICRYIFICFLYAWICMGIHIYSYNVYSIYLKRQRNCKQGGFHAPNRKEFIET